MVDEIETIKGNEGLGTDTPKEKKPVAVKKEEERKSFLKQAEELAARNEKAAESMQSSLERMEEIAARKLMGGGSEAGQTMEKPKEETPLEYTERIGRGEYTEEEKGKFAKGE